MEVPSLTSYRVPAGQGQLAPQQIAAPNLGAPLAAALKGLGSNLTALAERTQQLNERTDRFNAIKDYNEWQTYMDAKTVELKRDYRADGKDFADFYLKEYDKESAKFLKDRVPQSLQAEWAARMSADRQGTAAKALSFQYEASDAWFKKNINDAYQKSLSVVSQTPDAVDAELGRIGELVDNSDLSEIEKEQLKHNISIGLNGLKYKADVKAHKTLPVGEVTDDEAGAAAILRKEEGLRLSPYWDVNHHRVGYGSDTITKADGTVHRTTTAHRITKEEAELDLARRVKLFKQEWVKEVGAEKWEALPAKSRAAILSVTYNYGFDKKDLRSVIAAVNSGDNEAVATAIGSLGANPDRRAREAAIARGTGSIDTDPRYDKLPYDQRVQLREQAERELAHDQAQQASLEKQQNAAMLNDLKVGLHDGTYGPEEIKQARETFLNDYEDIKSVEKIYEDRMKGLNDAKTAAARLDGGIPFGDTKADNDQINALVAQNDGINKIIAGDESHFPMFTDIFNKTGRVPTEIRGILETMVNGANPQQAVRALDILERLRSINGDAFATSVPQQLQDKVQTYSVLKGQVEGQELVNRINGGANAEERQATMVLRKEGRDLLRSSEDGVINGRKLFEEVIGEFDESIMPWVSNPQAPAYAPQVEAMYGEFSEIFVEKYSKFGNSEAAMAATVEHLKRTWGVSEIGGMKTVMRLPPQAVGYKRLNGDYSWIDEAVRTELQLPADAKFQLFSDDNTQQEFDKKRLSKDGMVRSAVGPEFKTPGANDAGQENPSYKVILFDENGVPTGFAKNPATGRDLRVWVKPSQAAIDKQVRLFDKQAALANVQAQIKEFQQRGYDLPEGSPLRINTGPVPTNAMELYMQAKEREAELLKQVEDETRGPPEVMGVPLEELENSPLANPDNLKAIIGNPLSKLTNRATKALETLPDTSNRDTRSPQ